MNPRRNFLMCAASALSAMASLPSLVFGNRHSEHPILKRVRDSHQGDRGHLRCAEYWTPGTFSLRGQTGKYMQKVENLREILSIAFSKPVLVSMTQTCKRGRISIISVYKTAGATPLPDTELRHWLGRDDDLEIMWTDTLVGACGVVAPKGVRIFGKYYDLDTLRH